MSTVTVGGTAGGAPEARSMVDVADLAAHVRPGSGSQIWSMFRQGFRSHLRTTLIWGVAFGLLGALYVALWPSFEDSLDEMWSAIPEGYMEFLGIAGGISTIEGFLSMELFSLLAPLALPFFTIVIGARTIAGDEERQSLDIMLSNPIARWELLISRFLLMAAGMVVILTIMAVITWLPAPLTGVDLSLIAVLEGTANLWPFCLFFGAMALLCSALVRRNAVAIAVPVGVLVAMYVANALANVIGSIDGIRFASIFHYYGSPMTAGTDWVDFAGILAAAVLLLAAAIVAFRRRDILS